MKSLYLLFLPLIFSLSSCATQTGERSAKVISDCTGMYLQTSEGDYLVCNTDKIQDKVGQTVKVRFSKTNNCPENRDKIVCLMYHENLGLVRIASVR